MKSFFVFCFYEMRKSSLPGVGALFFNSPSPPPRRKPEKENRRSSIPSLLVLLVAALVDQRLVDVRNDTTTGDRRLDQRVELLVAADGELQVARRDALDLEVLGGVAGELEDLGGEVL
jgi:hypothetical protein